VITRTAHITPQQLSSSAATSQSHSALVIDFCFSALHTSQTPASPSVLVEGVGRLTEVVEGLSKKGVQGVDKVMEMEKVQKVDKQMETEKEEDIEEEEESEEKEEKGKKGDNGEESEGESDRTDDGEKGEEK
jgi:hypothetical protein